MPPLPLTDAPTGGLTVRRRGLLMTPATEEIIDQIWGSAASRMFVIAALGVLVFMIHW